MATADIKDIPSAHGKDSDPQQQTTKELKAERSQLRSNIMQIIKKVKSLMSDPENFEEVSSLAKSMEDNLAQFMAVQTTYDAALTSEAQKRKSRDFQEAVVAETSEIGDIIQTWLLGARKEVEDDQKQDTLQYPYSSSQLERQTGPRSTVTDRSIASSAKLHAAAERAALEAEAASEQQRQALEAEELRLRQQRRQIELQTKIARAAAMEKTYAEFEKLEGHSAPVENSTPNIQLKGKCEELKTPLKAKESEEGHQVVDFPSPISPIIDNSNVADILTQMLNTSQQQQQSLVDTLQLPKTELMTFNGDPIEYWPFIRAFENTVDRESVGDAAKLARLQQYCTGPAKRLIQCCAVKSPSEGYVLARKLLKDRFGNEHDISEAWINKIVTRSDIRDNKALRDYADDLRNCRETLNTMGKLSEINTGRSLTQIVEKLPWDLRKGWLKRVHHIKTVESKVPTIDDVVKFVAASAEQANDPVFGKLVSRDDTSKSRKNAKQQPQPRAKQRSTFSVQAQPAPAPPAAVTHQAAPALTSNPRSEKPPQACAYCGQAHGLFGCVPWKSLRVADRLNFVLGKQLCVNCLQPGHRARECRRQAVCTVPGCGLKHTKFLHLPRTRSDDSPQANSHPNPVVLQPVNHPTPTESSQLTPSASSHVTCSATGAGVSKVALPIVPVKVRQHGGSTEDVITYALLDSGSTHSFCSEALREKLGVPGRHEKMRLTTLENYDTPIDTFAVTLQVTDMNDDNILVMKHVLTRPKFHVSSNCLVSQKELTRWPHLCDIPLPDIDAREVHLLIGQDNPLALTPKEVREGGPGTPYAVRTILGWTLNGPIGNGQTKNVASHFTETDNDLQRLVERFWKIDDIGSNEPAMSISDQKVVSMWEQSLCIDEGHYSLDIPFKIRPPCLPDNKVIAEHRLSLLGRRLSRDSDMREKYVASMSDLLAKGYAEEVPEQELDRSDGAVWYLPHHPVVHPRKPGKVRIVFDCSAKYHGTSLNDNIYQGPDLTNQLLGVLLRFRQETIALMADIEGMFNQVRVNKADRDVLRFLWWINGFNKDPQTCRMTTHLFGGVWSPSTANFALKCTGRDNINRFDSETISTIDKNFYVDDCLTSVTTVQAASSLISQLCQALSLGGFRLTKWLSNSRDALRTVPEADRAKGVPTVDMDREMLPTERALGVLWDTQADTFKFDVCLKDKPLTRRGLLSTISSLYDPLGFACPFVLTAKILFQQLCRQKVEWDSPMPDDIAHQWKSWKEDLPNLKNMTVPRCLRPHGFGEVTSAQLHHFSDASEKGYGAATYLRILDTSGQMHCQLVMAKARLAPIKTTTIPRLELSAAVISVKLDELVCQHLSMPLEKSTYWTDSTIVLHYLQNQEKRYQVFVANRVSRILEHTSPAQWRYVETKENPGDDVSRGMTAEDLVLNDRWICGPRFLWDDKSEWPPQPDLSHKTLPDEAEVKKDTQVYSTMSRKDETDILAALLKKFSSWYQLKRAVAWLLRVKAILLARVQRKEKDMKPMGRLTVKEILAAEDAIVMAVQKDNFDDTTLKSSSYCKLSPSRFSDGIIRVGGRLANSPLMSEAKHPRLLPAKHPVIPLIVRHYHVASGHAGAERTLAEVRQRFWIIKGRAVVKSVVFNCIPCRRRKAPTVTQVMADLPQDRVTPGHPPFTMVGVDYFGPFMIRRARSEIKRWGCLFTCLATRAIHLEVSYTMETDSFINALQRFISRRGAPVEIRSDNGTNFVGGQRELQRALKCWNQDKICDYLRQKEIQWVFNPPAASHFGGVWERQIRTVRLVLNGLLGQQTLDDEGLHTLLCIVEGIVNGRPMTKLSEDPDDPEPLTPNHLLLLRSGPQLPPGEFTKQDIYKRRWRQVQYLADVFWRRWSSEYLSSLQERQKWLYPQRNIRKGDLVLVKYETSPRNQWPLGLVTNVYPGRDGRVRTVQVKTRAGIYDRPTDKLCLLEGVDMGQ